MVGVWWVLVGSALADDSSVPSADSTFAFLDRFDGTQRVGISATPSFESSTGYNATLLEIHSQVFDPPTRIGAYARAPMSLDSGRIPVLGGRGQFGGSVDAGVAYLAPINCVSTFVIRAGISIPTGMSTDSEAAYISRYAKPSDAVEFIAGGNWGMRVAGAWLYRRGPLFARVDLGFDVPFGSATLGHLDAGTGYALPHVSLSAELSTLQGTGALGDGSPESFGPNAYLGMVFIGGSAVLRTGPVRPYVGVLAYVGSMGDVFGTGYPPSFFVTTGIDVIVPWLR